MLVCQPFAPALSAVAVAEALAEGLTAAGRAQPELCPLPASSRDPAALLARLDFDPRMRAARALVVATQLLSRETLPGSLAFELATRARQSGVPCYAVSADSRLDAFDARILDLQLVLVADTAAALRSAGRRLAEVI